MPSIRKYDEANAVILAGNELGEGLSFDQLWHIAKQYARDNFVGKDKDGNTREFVITSNGYKVRIPMTGIKHTLEFAKTIDDIYAVIALPQLLERSIRGEDGISYSVRPSIDHVETYYASLKIGKKEYVAEMIILVEKGSEKNRKLSNLRFFHHQRIKGPVDQ